MLWNWMQLMEHAEDYRVESGIGPGEMSRDEARAAVQGILDGLVSQFSDLVEVAERWRQGETDTVSFDALTWTVFPHDPGEVQAGAHARLEEFAARDRSEGYDAQVMRPRASPAEGQWSILGPGPVHD